MRSSSTGIFQEDIAVPDTIQGVLMARIDRFPEAHKRLLQTASVLGREFSLGCWRRSGKAQVRWNRCLRS